MLYVNHRADVAPCGAVWSPTRISWTRCSPSRTNAQYIELLCFLDQQAPAEGEPIVAILNTLDMHHGRDRLHGVRLGATAQVGDSGWGIADL